MALNKLKDFFSQFPERKFRKLEDLIPIDESVKHIFFLTQGYVRQYTVSPEGEELTLNIFKPQTFFPLNLALHQQINPYYFSAYTQGKYRAAPVDKVILFLKKDPELLFSLTERLTSGINGLLLRMESMVFGNAEQRVAATLYLLFLRFGRGNEDTQIKREICPDKKGAKNILSLQFTHQDLAFLSGLTRETVSGVMSDFKSQKLINYKKQYICISDPEKLKEISALSLR